MSLLFSTVTITPKAGPFVTIQESGHPDEYDLREMLRYEKRYAPVRKTEYRNAVIAVRQYRFRVGGPDWLAERDCFALMDAYDSLALRHGERTFVQREDVELVEQYEFQLDLCDLCGHGGFLTMADTAACNCCEDGEFFEPDIHAEKESESK